MKPYYETVLGKLYQTDTSKPMPFPDNHFTSVITDPPYELGFMGKKWDSSGIAYNVDMWKEVLRVLKPGGHLLSFGGTRTYHRMACAIEDAGFEIRDMIEWVYGSGFPKSLNVGKAVDKLQGNEREDLGIPKVYGDGHVQNYGGEKQGYHEWKAKGIETQTKGTSEFEGYGSALKPSHEPICLARKPLSEKTVAENVLKWGTGALNIDESRIGTGEDKIKGGCINRKEKPDSAAKHAMGNQDIKDACYSQGRWPANLIHDNSEEVRECFPEAGKGNGKGAYNYAGREYDNKDTSMFNGDKPQAPSNFNDSGNASRFFKSIIYTAKASKAERAGSTHPTIKPKALIEYLVKLSAPPKDALILDPFIGSGTLGCVCEKLGIRYVGMDLDCADAKMRIEQETIQMKLF